MYVAYLLLVLIFFLCVCCLLVASINFFSLCMFLALGIDSRLVFYELNPVRYTLMLGKPFPRLDSFTIAMWLKVYRSYHNGTIISYKVRTGINGGKSLLLLQ